MALSANQTPKGPIIGGTPIDDENPGLPRYKMVIQRARIAVPLLSVNEALTTGFESAMRFASIPSLIAAG